MIRINLIPAEYAAARAKKEQQILLGAGAGIVVVVLVAFLGFKRSQASSLQEKIQTAESDLKTYQATIDQINQIQADKTRLMTKRDVILGLNRSRLVYPVFFEDLLPLIPSDVWVSDIRFERAAGTSQEYRLSSKALSNFAVATWLTNLEQSTHFTNIKIDRINYEYAPTDKTNPTLSFQLSFSYQHQGPLPLSEMN
jgi:type IV pilus assembly protein PilN